MTGDEWELSTQRKDEYLRIGDIVDRFKNIDATYNHTEWNLKQIFANLNILMGVDIKEDIISEIDKLPTKDIEFADGLVNKAIPKDHVVDIINEKFGIKGDK